MLDVLPWSTLSGDRPSAPIEYGCALEAVTAIPGFDLELVWPLDRLRWLPRPLPPRIIALFASRPVAIHSNQRKINKFRDKDYRLMSSAVNCHCWLQTSNRLIFEGQTYLAGYGEVKFCQKGFVRKDSYRKDSCLRMRFCCANCAIESHCWTSCVYRWVPNVLSYPKWYYWLCLLMNRCCCPAFLRPLHFDPNRLWNSDWSKLERPILMDPDWKMLDRHPIVDWSGNRRWMPLSIGPRSGWPASANKRSSLDSLRKEVLRLCGCWPERWLLSTEEL